MTKPPTKRPDDPQEDPLSPIVEQFLFQWGKDERLSVDTFCAEHPRDIREDLRRRCLEALRVERTLAQIDSDEISSDGPGDERIGEFRLERVLGRGSFGVVYLAWQESLARYVALKVLAVNPDVEVLSVERFRREAVAAGKLRHSNIVPVHSVGEADGKLFLVMDFIDGPTLGKALAETKDASASDSVAVVPEAAGGSGLGSASRRGYPGCVAGIIADLAEALQFAHDHEIIHRDVKPQNVLMDQDGNPYLADFGLAKDLNEMSLSRVGDQAGSPPYMSPEQALAKRIPIDYRTDVFSLGVVMYEMLALRRPFEGESLASLFYEIAFKEPTKLRKLNPRVPRDLETICHKALQKNPDNRFQRAGDMADNLRRFLNHESIIVQPPRWHESVWRSVVRHRVAAGVMGVMLLSAVLSAVLWAQVIRAEQLDRMLTPLRELAAVADFSAEPRKRLLDGARESKRAMARVEEMSNEDRATILSLRNRLLEFGHSEKERGSEMMRESFVAGDLRSSYERLTGFSVGLGHLMTAMLLLPSDQTNHLSESESWYPKLSVRSQPEQAEVILQRLNRLTDQVESVIVLGQTPIQSRSVPPGYYRIIVRKRGFGYAELTRVLDAPGREFDEQVVRLRKDTDAVTGMVRIAGGPFIFGSGNAKENRPYHRRQETLESFWISKTEVTNAEYLEFVEATGAERPKIWPKLYDTGDDELPVVGVNYFDAKSYCEWRGGRLPTLWEWERAARGATGLQFPQTLADVGLEDYVLRDPTLSTIVTNRLVVDQMWKDYRAIYIRRVHSVREPDASRGPEGLLHTLDNVSEWTDSVMFAKRDKDVLVPQSASRIVKGSSFKTSIHAASLTRMTLIPAEMCDLAIGFRLAKSVLE